MVLAPMVLLEDGSAHYILTSSYHRRISRTLIDLAGQQLPVSSTFADLISVVQQGTERRIHLAGTPLFVDGRDR